MSGYCPQLTQKSDLSCFMSWSIYLLWGTIDGLNPDMRHYNHHRLCIRVTEVLAINLYTLTKRDLNAFALFSMHSIFEIDKNMKQMRNIPCHIVNSKPIESPSHNVCCRKMQNMHRFYQLQKYKQFIIRWLKTLLQVIQLKN